MARGTSKRHQHKVGVNAVVRKNQTNRGAKLEGVACIRGKDNQRHREERCGYGYGATPREALSKAFTSLGAMIRPY